MAAKSPVSKEQAELKAAQDRAIACIGEALGHLEARRLTDAEKALTKAKEANPGHPQVHYLFAELAVARGDRPGAIQHLRLALGWERKRPEPYVLLARLLHAEGNSGLAARLLERALDLDLTHLPAQRLLRELHLDPQNRTEHPELERFARKPTIGLAMIVKNEALHLARCLRSARPHVQDMVVVDTGSTDATVAIAKMMGARVLHFDWVHDFAAARNHALAQLTTDWTLVLDADEELEAPPEHLVQILENLPLPEHTGIVPLVWLKLYNHGGSVVDRDPWESMPIARLFPTGCIQYQGAAHETPELAAGRSEELKAFQAFSIELHHHGYRPETLKGRDKLNRNIELMEKRIAANPKDTDVLYLMGRELVYAERYEEGLAALDRYQAGAIEADKRQMLFRLTPFLRALALEKLDREDEALAALDWGLELDPDFPTYSYYKGEILASKERYHEAIECYTKALEGADYHERHGLANYNAIVPAHAGSLAFQRRERAAALALGQPLPTDEKLPPAQEAIRKAMEALGEGRLDDAERHLMVAVRLNPTHSQVAYLEAELAFRRGAVPEALEKAFASLQLGPNMADVWALLGFLLHEDENSELGAFCLQQALKLAPDHVNVKELLRQVQAHPRRRAQHPQIVQWLQAMQQAQQQAQAQAAQAAARPAFKPAIQIPPKR